MEDSGILREFCATSGKNCNKQCIFSSSFKYLCKTAVDWVNRIIRILGSSDPAQYLRDRATILDFSIRGVGLHTNKVS